MVTGVQTCALPILELNSKHCHFVVALSVEQMPADAHAVYTGKRQSGVATGNGAILGQANNEASWFWRAYNLGPLSTNQDYIATEAGTYTVKLMLQNEHVWADMTDAPRWLTYTIEKAPLTAQVLDETIAVGDTPTLRVVASGFVNGEDRSTCISYESPVATAPESQDGLGLGVTEPDVELHHPHPASGQRQPCIQQSGEGRI